MYTRERFNSCLYSRLDLAKNGTDRGNRARTEGTRAEPSPPESKFVRIRFSSEDRSSMNVYETSICIELAASTPSSLRLAALSTFDPSSFSDIRLSLSLSLPSRGSLFSLSLARAGYTVVAPALSHPKSLSLSSKFFNPFDRTTSRSVSKRARLLSFHSRRDIIYLFVYIYFVRLFFFLLRFTGIDTLSYPSTTVPRIGHDGNALVQQLSSMT